MNLVGSLTLTHFLHVVSAHRGSTAQAPGRGCGEVSRARRMCATVNALPFDVVHRFNDHTRLRMPCASPSYSVTKSYVKLELTVLTRRYKL